MILLSNSGFICHSRTCRHLKNNRIYVHNTLFISVQGAQAQMLCRTRPSQKRGCSTHRGLGGRGLLTPALRAERVSRWDCGHPNAWHVTGSCFSALACCRRGVGERGPSADILIVQEEPEIRIFLSSRSLFFVFF